MIDKISDLLKEYKELHETLKPLSERLSGLKEAISEEMEKLPNDYLKFDNVSATKVTTTRVTYSRPKLEKLFTVDQLAPARKETVSNFVKITVSKEDK